MIGTIRIQAPSPEMELLIPVVIQVSTANDAGGGDGGFGGEILEVVGGGCGGSTSYWQRQGSI